MISFISRGFQVASSAAACLNVFALFVSFYFQPAAVPTSQAALLMTSIRGRISSCYLVTISVGVVHRLLFKAGTLNRKQIQQMQNQKPLCSLIAIVKIQRLI